MKRNYVAAILYEVSAFAMAYWREGAYEYQQFCGEEIPVWERVAALGCCVFAAASLVVLLNFRSGLVVGIVAACLSCPCFGLYTLVILLNPGVIRQELFGWVDVMGVGGFVVATAFSLFHLRTTLYSWLGMSSCE
jgi:hypothetical protein